MPLARSCIASTNARVFALSSPRMRLRRHRRPPGLHELGRSRPTPDTGRARTSASRRDTRDGPDEERFRRRRVAKAIAVAPEQPRVRAGLEHQSQRLGCGAAARTPASAAVNASPPMCVNTSRSDAAKNTTDERYASASCMMRPGLGAGRVDDGSMLREVYP